MLNNLFAGSNYIYTETQKLLVTDRVRVNSDSFGETVAISADGNTLVCGAVEQDDSPITDNGAAYVFIRSGLTWVQQARLVSDNPQNFSYFGYPVGISSDGNTIIVGAYTEDTLPYTNNGAAYVFTRSGITWTQQQKLLANDRQNNDNFGVAVALSDDGNTALIGAWLKDSPANSDSGAAYVFTRSGSVWTEQRKLVANDAQAAARFGIAVALSSNGNTALIGAPLNSTPTNTRQGAAYVFTRSGSEWTEQQKLLAEDRQNNDYFGSSVALSSDGNTALIGATGEGPPALMGAAYVFTRSGSVWTQQQKLVANDRAFGDQFGYSIALSSDGNTALVSAPLDSDSTVPGGFQGSAYVFTRSESGWNQRQKLLATLIAAEDFFGSSVDLSSDGNIAIIGSPDEDTTPTTNNGAVYIFSL